MPETRVAVREVSLEVDGARLVDQVTFSASAGEFIGLIGPNGAGKSTLLGIVGGQQQPGEGGVELLGSSISGVSSRSLATMRSMLGPNPPGDIPFTARTVVEAGRYPYRGLPETSAEEDERLVSAALETAEVTALAARSYRTLSSGEQARVMIARVIAQSCPIALLDEPTASLDVANGERALRALAGVGSTVICVLHDLNQASHFCDRLILMSAGRLVRVGPPEKVLDEAVLSDVYGQSMRVVDHPFRACPLVLVI